MVAQDKIYGYGSINDALAKGFENWPDATDKSGFSVIPAGYDNNNLSYFEINFFKATQVDSRAYFWASAENSASGAEKWSFNAEEIEYSEFFKTRALNVRCFKDFE